MLNTQVNSYIVQGKGNIVSDMGGEKVMMSIEKGKYYNLGEMGGAIWDLIKTPITVNQLVDILVTEYRVEKFECEGQVINFLNHLLNEGLIEVDSKRLG